MNYETWGLRPVLFHIGKIPIEAYPIFMLLALMTGLAIYKYQLRRDGIRNANALYIVMFALIGGVIGSKLPIIAIYWKEINSDPKGINLLLSGRTIVGGLIGGMAGTILAKKAFKIKDRMGNQIAVPVASAMAVGRVGCLFRGCCYGKPTGISLGIDFGDHIPRHPTQIYEILFDLSLVFYLSWRKKRGVLPGELFRIFLNFYLSFRFLIEFIRVEKISFLGLTDFQLLCAVSLIYINRNVFLQLIKRRSVREL